MKTEQKILAGIIGFTILVGIIGLAFLKKMSGTTSSQQVAVDRQLLIREDSFSKGDESAVVELVEFSDFECPACAATAPFVDQLTEKYPGLIKLTYRHYPLAYHKHARQAAAAVEAAGKQDKFWEMHDKIFETQAEWESNNDNKELFISYAVELELDKDQFNSDMESDEIKNKIARDLADGNAVGVDATPSFFINGKKTAGFGTDNFNELLEEALSVSAESEE